VSDIFNEVDEEVRREQLKRLWDRYGTLIVAALILFVIAIAGWRAYEWWAARKAAETGAAFEAAMVLSDQGKTAEAQAAFAKIAADGNGGYRVLARLREISELAQTDSKAAVSAYDAMSTDSSVSQVLRDLAALRAGGLQVDIAPYDQVQRRLEPLTSATGPFRHTAREYLALSAWRAGDTAATKKWVDAILSDGETPAAARSRADVLSALTASDGKS